MRKFNRCEGAAGFAAICRGLSAASLLALTFSAPGEAVGAKDQFKGVSAEVEDDVAGIAGAISRHTGDYPPPLDGSRWEWKGEVTGDDVWGRKVESGAPYLTSSGIGHIVNGQGRYNGQSYASIPLLLGTNDLNSWDSYPRPVLEYADWQLEGWANTIASGGNKWGRVSPHALVYDDENSQFMLVQPGESYRIGYWSMGKECDDPIFTHGGRGTITLAQIYWFNSDLEECNPRRCWGRNISVEEAKFPYSWDWAYNEAFTNASPGNAMYARFQLQLYCKKGAVWMDMPLVTLALPPELENCNINK